MVVGRAPNRVAVAAALLLLVAARTSSGQPPDGAAREVASVSGTVLDPTGVAVPDAEVTLTATLRAAAAQTSRSKGDGQFSFTHLAPSSYVVVVRAPGFQTFETSAFTVAAQQAVTLPPIRLLVAGFTTSAATEIIAEQQIKAQEQQRVLGVLPNFYVSYVPDAAPMTARQKRSLAVHQTFDWTVFPRVAISAAVQQAVHLHSGFGDGASGYGKRWAARFANERASDLLGQYVFPSLFHHDPRYFFQGTGTRRSRFVHGLSWALVARSDSGELMPNYASLFGNVAAGALSNLYYPHRDRGIGLVLTNAAIGIASRAVQGVFQEVLTRPNVPVRGSPARHWSRRHESRRH